MNRKADGLLPLEVSILCAAADLARSGHETFYGYQLAKLLGKGHNSKTLIGFGTLYKALERLERRGCLESRLEDPETAASDHRPRRRLYRVTAIGVSLLKRAPAKQEPTRVRSPKPYTA